MTPKFCRACRITKASWDFDWDEGEPDALSTKCKVCRWGKRRRDIKVVARTMTNQAIRWGFIKRKPCEVCGSANSHVHHRDYTKPYDIQFLCGSHHKQEHVRLIKEVGGPWRRIKNIYYYDRRHKLHKVRATMVNERPAF